VQSKEKDYDPSRLREIMDSFRAILFKHLDAEVHSLRAENMKIYWNEKEMKAIPI